MTTKERLDRLNKEEQERLQQGGGVSRSQAMLNSPQFQQMVANAVSQLNASKEQQAPSAVQPQAAQRNYESLPAWQKVLLDPNMQKAVQKYEEPAPVTMEDVYNPYDEEMNRTRQQMAEAEELNEDEMRRENSRKVIASLGDAFASFANLWGTTRNAENMDQTYSAPLVSDSIDAARKIRFGRMAQLRDKLDAQRNALLQYKIDNDPDTLQNRLAQQRINNTSLNAELRGRDIDRKLGNDAANAALNTRKQDEVERANQIKEQQNQQKIDQQGKKDAATISQGWSRIQNERDRIDIQRENNGDGEGTWKKSSTANYNAFKEEIAANNGYGSWEEFYQAQKYSPSLGSMVESIESANSTDKQKAAISSYAERYAPRFFDQYYRKEQKQYGQEPPKKGGLDAYGGGSGSTGTSRGGSRARSSYGGR